MVEHEISRISHHLLVVANLKASLELYSDKLGLEVLQYRRRTDPEQLYAWVGSLSYHLILCEGPTSEPAIGPYGHVGISVPSYVEFLSLHDRLQTNGEVVEPLHEGPWPICKWFALRDPDLNRVEVSFGQDMTEINWNQWRSSQHAQLPTIERR